MEDDTALTIDDELFDDLEFDLLFEDEDWELLEEPLPLEEEADEEEELLLLLLLLPFQLLT